MATTTKKSTAKTGTQKSTIRKKKTTSTTATTKSSKTTTTSRSKSQTTKSTQSKSSGGTKARVSTSRTKKTTTRIEPVKETPKTRKKSATKAVNKLANSISFTNERISKALTYTATYNGGDSVDFSMNLHDNDGNLIHCSIPIKTIRQILKPNYNIGIIGFVNGIYTYEFNRVDFEKFLSDNGI